MASKKFDLKLFLLKNFSFISKYRFVVQKNYKATFKFLRYLPGRSTWFGPPRGIYKDVAGYNQKHPAKKITENVMAATQTTSRNLPVTNSQMLKEKFGKYLTGKQVDKIAYTIPQGRYLYGNGGTIITADDKVFLPVSPLRNEWNPDYHQSLYLLSLPKMQVFDKVILIDTRASEQNYCHWMKDHITRFYWLQQLQLDFSEYTLISSNGNFPYHKFSYDVLQANGFNFKQVLNVKDVAHFKANELLIAPYSTQALNGNHVIFSDVEANFIKQNFQNQGDEITTYEKIYISRRKSGRSSPQEPELVEKLTAYGFKEIFLEQYTIYQQARLFNAAKVIVGFHGAGLTNMFFCNTESIVVEIFGANYIVTDYWAMANQLKLNYHAYCNDEFFVKNASHREGRLTSTQINTDAFVTFFKGSKRPSNYNKIRGGSAIHWLVCSINS